MSSSVFAGRKLRKMSNFSFLVFKSMSRRWGNFSVLIVEKLFISFPFFLLSQYIYFNWTRKHWKFPKTKISSVYFNFKFFFVICLLSSGSKQKTAKQKLAVGIRHVATSEPKKEPTWEVHVLTWRQVVRLTV